jgi:hypothetical protein
MRGDTRGRSVQMKTAAGRERYLAYGEILVDVSATGAAAGPDRGSGLSGQS